METQNVSAEYDPHHNTRAENMFVEGIIQIELTPLL
jgi:hypothetical protein